MNVQYKEFLKSKHENPQYAGFEIQESDVHPMLYKFQNAIVRWSLALGKAAIFAECGLGKTFMQVEWARHVSQHTAGRVIIVAPLAVTGQTIIEADKIGIKIDYVADESEMQSLPADAIVITNYDRIHKFDCSQFDGVALDESSILKNFTGKTKQMLAESFRQTPYKLACTATPAPNDFLEIGNHADFLDVMPSNEMIMRWFKNDTMAAGNYILKSHGRDDFYRWLTSWAVCISHPRDLGAEYDMPNFDLPELNMLECSVGYSQATLDRASEQGMLFPDVNVSSTGLHALKRESLDLRVAEAQRIVDTIDDDEPIIFWCDTNDEAQALQDAFSFAIEVNGSDKREDKVNKLQSFTEQKYRAIITKPSIAGFGLNWQHCTHQILVGVSFSFEKTYQALRRSYRFGVKKPVNAYMIFSESEGNVVQAIHKKQRQFIEMQTEMTKAMENHGLFRDQNKTELKTPEYQYESGKNWELHLGDCVEQIAKIDDNSIDYGIHSPPFANLYIYSASEADMGNSSDNDEFFKHYKYLIREMYRTTKVGRLCSVHCKDLPLYKGRDGAMGLQDFAGDIIRAFEEMDKPDIDDYDSISAYKRDLAEWQIERKTKPKWVFHSRVNIWKDPVIEMQRTKNHGLLHKNFTKDASGVRQGMADYLITFRKWDVDNEDLIEPVTQKRVIGDYIGTKPPSSEQYEYSYNGLPMDEKEQQRAYSIAVWQRYASPVWFDIDQTNVLNHKIARDNDDEKHICPLQLDVIRKGIDLWSNEGDTVFSPFAGVGSELVTAIRMNRKAIGIELKESYFKTAIRHLQEAEKAKQQLVMF